MNTVYWIFITLSFLLSFVGLIYPFLPAVLMVWIGVAIYYFLISSTTITTISWVTLILLTIILFVTDYLANFYFVKRYGGSRLSGISAIIGAVIGIFIAPPFGIIIVPFILVLLTEMLQQKDADQSLKVALGTIIAFLSSTFAKAVIQLMMILVFLFSVWFN